MLAHVSARRTVSHLFQVAGVRNHEGPARQVEHVELDQVDARLDRSAEGADGVLRGEERRAAVADP